MNSKFLSEILEEINLPTQENDSKGFYALKIPNYNNHYFGFTSVKQPCLLIRCIDNIPKSSMSLTNFDVVFNEDCSVSVRNNKLPEHKLTSIVCTSDNNLIKFYFNYICETILSILGNEPSSESVFLAVKHMTELFKSIDKPGIRDIKGLIGELLFIYLSSDIKTAVISWRESVHDNYDFKLNKLAIEAKACKSIKREHNFTYEQANPPSDITAILFSLFVESSDDEGMTLQELIEKIKSSIPEEIDLLKKLNHNLFTSLGSKLASIYSYTFDYKLAEDSIMLYNIEKIPAIRGELPKFVSKVKFKSDLEETPKLEKSEIELHKEGFELISPFFN